MFNGYTVGAVVIGFVTGVAVYCVSYLIFERDWSQRPKSRRRSPK